LFFLQATKPMQSIAIAKVSCFIVKGLWSKIASSHNMPQPPKIVNNAQTPSYWAYYIRSGISTPNKPHARFQYLTHRAAQGKPERAGLRCFRVEHRQVVPKLVVFLGQIV
jgi:hypothetical protein